MSPQTPIYLRLSITDQCNFNCFYCRPSARDHFFEDDQVLGKKELREAVRAFVRLGIRHVRLTGGEPLVRPDAAELIRDLAVTPWLERLSLTTNGYRLGDFSDILEEGCLGAVNVSLDTLQRSRFSKIVGRDALPMVKNGILAARKAGTASVKLNVLLIKGFNDDEITDFVEFAGRHGLDLRFIEYFPTQRRSDIFKKHYVPSQDVLSVIKSRYGSLEYLGADSLAGPAQYYRIRQERFRIGVISSVTDFFCGACNRLRLTADGRLYPCLHSDFCADLGPAIKEGDAETLEALIRGVMENKKEYTRISCRRLFEMSAIGG